MTKTRKLKRLAVSVCALLLAFVCLTGCNPPPAGGPADDSPAADAARAVTTNSAGYSHIPGSTSDLAVTLDLNGADFVKLVGANIQAGDYSYSTGTLTISAAWLNSQREGIDLYMTVLANDGGTETRCSFVLTIGRDAVTSNQFQWDSALDSITAEMREYTQATVNSISGLDSFGRGFDTVDGFKADRYIGLFYFAWMGQEHKQEIVYDVSKINAANNAANFLNNKSYSDGISKDGAFHFWGEPMYGYYNSRDPWVIKKHIELFTLAGVDFLIFDNTNGAEYIEVLGVMMPIMQELYDQGWNVPKLVMYTNSYSKDVIKRLYYGTGASYEASTAHRKLDQPLDPKYEAVTREITQNGIYGNTGDGGKYQYKDLWFCPNGDGKPMIVGITRPDNTSASDTTQDVKNHMVDDPVLLNFFYFRESTWPNAAVYSTGFPWIDFVHPQVNYGDAINVGVGQHCYNGNVIPFSYTIDNGQYYNGTWGRGANAANHGTSASHSLENIRKGLNFEEQWAVAKARDVRFTYVTGWNEWVALKYWDGSKYIFVDTYSEEFSRDAEMMKGGYEDNFYLSICRNIRSQTGLKGAAARETKNLIDINKGLAQWNGTGKTYVNMVTEKERNYRGFATGKFNYSDPSADLGKVFYLENYSVVNQVTQVRVTHDSEYVYFLIECDDTITPWNSPLNTNDSWLNLLIGVDGVGGSPLHGYNFLAGGSKDASGFASLERLSFDGTTLSKTDRPGDSASYTYNGRYAQYRVKKSSLLLGNNSQFTLRFKVVDNVENLTDIASYYTTGNCAPAGRLSYTFYG